MDTVVDGLIFDLDDTLLDRQATFLRVAGNFYEEHLCATMSVNRDDAVAMMVRWDAYGHSNREEMLTCWLNEWPEAGLDMKSLTEWYRSAMDRQVQPDMEVNQFLTDLNDQQVPWGIDQGISTANVGRRAWINLPHSSLFPKRLAMPSLTLGYSAMP